MEPKPFMVGDQIKIVFKVPKGSKTKLTPFEGIVISLRGQGENRTFTVRKIATGNIAVERIFPINSPNIEQIKVLKQGRVRKAKLYYLRKKL